ncbi:WXG100 family type VII secretion target [Streptomyces lavendulae]|nr:WXG100 family type VII secretion target [Streptomyces lavendulae]
MTTTTRSSSRTSATCTTTAAGARMPERPRAAARARGALSRRRPGRPIRGGTAGTRGSCLAGRRREARLAVGVPVDLSGVVDQGDVLAELLQRRADLEQRALHRRVHLGGELAGRRGERVVGVLGRGLVAAGQARVPLPVVGLVLRGLPEDGVLGGGDVRAHLLVLVDHRARLDEHGRLGGAQRGEAHAEVTGGRTRVLLVRVVPAAADVLRVLVEGGRGRPGDLVLRDEAAEVLAVVGALLRTVAVRRVGLGQRRRVVLGLYGAAHAHSLVRPAPPRCWGGRGPALKNPARFITYVFNCQCGSGAACGNKSRAPHRVSPERRVMAGEVDYDSSSLHVSPQGVASSAKNLVELSKEVADTTRAIGDRIFGLRLSWEGKAASEAQAVMDEWNRVMRELFGLKDENTPAVLPVLAGGVSDAEHNYSLVENGIKSGFDKFHDALTAGGSSDDHPKDKPPGEETDTNKTAITMTFPG